MTDFDPAISTGLGLEVWVNHLAFAASDLDEIEDRKQRWLGSGNDVVEIDHGWCTSIYTNDPNGIAVEFCTTTTTFTERDHNEAMAILYASEPPLETPPDAKFFLASKHGAKAR